MAIYDRQPTESGKAYEAFAIYRDLGTNRSIEAAWKQHSKSVKPVPGYFSAWSSTHSWVARAAAYDDHIEQKARKQLEREAVQRKVDMLKRHGMAGRLMQRKGAEYLDKHGVDRGVDAINALKTGVAMERAAEGLPEYLLEIVNADDSEIVRQYHALLAEVGGLTERDGTPGDTDTGTPSAPLAQIAADDSD